MIVSLNQRLLMLTFVLCEGHNVFLAWFRTAFQNLSLMHFLAKTRLIHKHVNVSVQNIEDMR